MTALRPLLQDNMHRAAEAVVAIPVKNEAARIADCLLALDRQQAEAAPEILLLLNDCTDETGAIVRTLMPSLSVRLHIVETTFTARNANAGHARSLAMRLAAEAASRTGVLLTTDADGRVAPDWLAANLAALRAGAEAVAGRAQLDPVEAALIPAHLHDDDARECAFGTMLDEIDCLVDPDPFDPWPRHTEHSGASIAVTCAAWRRAGGMPAPQLGEDRAFFAALRRVDAAIRHDPAVQVVVSGRTDGRARGGMADTIRRRISHQDEFLDDQMEPALDRLRRATLRAACRAAWVGQHRPAGLAEALALPEADVRDWLLADFFGEAWQNVESASTVLARRPVARRDLAAETAAAASVLATLRENAPGDEARATAPPTELAA